VERLVAEHWTISGERLILVGPIAEVERVAQRLCLPCDTVVRVSPLRAALPLWGDRLMSYQATHHDDLRERL
jgi:hypothetical protein